MQSLARTSLAQTFRLSPDVQSLSELIFALLPDDDGPEQRPQRRADFSSLDLPPDGLSHVAQIRAALADAHASVG